MALKETYFLDPNNGANRARASGRQPNERKKVNRAVVGLLEEEEKGIGIFSNTVNVEGEDLATPGHESLRGNKSR